MNAFARVKALKHRLFLRSEGIDALKERYAKFFGKPLDCAHPSTFTEKLFVLMIDMHRYPNPLFTRLADKYLARDYVGETVGAAYLPELLWHGEDPRAIPFEVLRDEYVIKTNHGSGQSIIVCGAVDRAALVEHFSRALRTNYYWTAREYQYYAIEPRLLVEELIDDGQPDGPLDYRFWCFSGSPHLIQVDNHAHGINPFYDLQWHKLHLSYRSRFADVEIARPARLEEMLRVASTLSAGLDFARVDLYQARDRIYVGEVTLTPKAGNLKFTPASWDVTLGRRWALAREGAGGDTH